MPATKKLMKTQATDAPCQNLEEVLRKGGTGTFNEGKLLCRRAFTEGAIHFTVSELYRRIFLYHRRCPTLAGHPGIRRIYDVLRKAYYWLHKASNVQEFVFKCGPCRRHRPLRKHQRWLQLLPQSVPLEFIAIAILGPLIKTKQGNRFVIVMTNSYSKLTWFISIPKTTKPFVAMVVLET